MRDKGQATEWARQYPSERFGMREQNQTRKQGRYEKEIGAFSRLCWCDNDENVSDFVKTLLSYYTYRCYYNQLWWYALLDGT